MDKLDDLANTYAEGTTYYEERYFILLCEAAKRYLKRSGDHVDIDAMLQALKENLEK